MPLALRWSHRAGARHPCRYFVLMTNQVPTSDRSMVGRRRSCRVDVGLRSQLAADSAVGAGSSQEFCNDTVPAPLRLCACSAGIRSLMFEPVPGACVAGRGCHELLRRALSRARRAGLACHNCVIPPVARKATLTSTCSFASRRGVGAEGVEPSCPKAAGFKPAVSAVPPRALRPA